MITLEVHGQLVNWPEDFALVMMRYYWNHGVPFKIYRHFDQPALIIDKGINSNSELH